MTIRRIAGRVAVIAVLAVGVSPAAFAKPPHWNQADGCYHGNSGKPCRPDPQPTKGKDCLPHGNWGGINEDHCLPAPIGGGGDL